VSWRQPFQWLSQLFDRRSNNRELVSTLVEGYYWDGAVPQPHRVRDISTTGAYLITDQKWYIGTLLTLTLQIGGEAKDPQDYITVPCQIVRHGADGIGVKFVLSSREERMAIRRFVRAASVASSPGGRSSGEAVVEFALVVPLLFLLIVNAFNFGGFIYCWLTVSDAVRAAADYACTDTSTAGSPAPPTVSAITSLVQNATARLPDYSSANPVVTACIYNNGTTSNFLTSAGCPAGVTSPPADPEPIVSGSTTTYATVAVDVTYTFTPILAGSTFLRFGLPALPTTIHRRTVVRWP
jgi:Flp pilus assembly protein TadG